MSVIFSKFLDVFSYGQNESKDESEEPERPGVIISNHVSYIDILYHMSSFFPSFVAKVCSLCSTFVKFDGHFFFAFSVLTDPFLL